jgi:hypothetical protein
LYEVVLGNLEKHNTNEAEKGLVIKANYLNDRNMRGEI